MLHTQIPTGALSVAQVWCLAVSTMGDFAVTSGADRALRIWQRTEEPFFVEEEKEKRLESLFEADLEVLNCPVYGPALLTQIVHLFFLPVAGASLLQNPSVLICALAVHARVPILRFLC